MPAPKKGQYAFSRWMGPLLDGLRVLGGSAKPREVSNWIARELQLPLAIIVASLKSGGLRFHNQVQWARQYLVWEGLLDDSRSGIRALTPLGWKARVDEAAGRTILLDRMKMQQSVRRQSSAGRDASEPDSPESTPPEEAQDLDLLDILKALPPCGCELICGRLLHEHGFEEVEGNAALTRRRHRWLLAGCKSVHSSAFVWPSRPGATALPWRAAMSANSATRFWAAPRKASSSPPVVARPMPPARRHAMAWCRLS